MYELITSRCFITFSKTPHSGHFFFWGGELHDAFPRDKTVCLLLGASQIHCNVFEILPQKLYMGNKIKIYILEKVLNEFLHKNERPAKREMGHIRIYIYVY